MQHRKDLPLNTGILCLSTLRMLCRGQCVPGWAPPSLAPGQTKGLYMMLTMEMVLPSPQSIPSKA